jgi:hypothetical protein
MLEIFSTKQMLSEPTLQSHYSTSKKNSFAFSFARQVLSKTFSPPYVSAAALILCSSVSVSASDIYIAQTSQGLGTGTNASNSFPVSFFNASANWSSPIKIGGKIGPGDTVHLVGTITSALMFQKGGTPKAGAGTGPITLLFEPGAIMTSPAWPNANNATGAITVPNNLGAGLGYIIIDGGSNGIIQNTANGTALANKLNSLGVALIETHDSIVRNLTVRNLYVRNGPSNDQHHCGIGVKIFFNGGRNPATNDLVSHCTFHDEFEGVTFIYGTGWTNMELAFSTVYNCNWGGNAADSHNASSLTGLLIHDNDFYDFTNWDDNSVANSNHHNGFYGWAVSGGRLRDVSYFNNIVGPNFGATATSGIYNSGDIGSILIYNNLFLESGSNDKPTNGLIYILPNLGSTGTGYKVYNNTFIGGGGGIAINFSGGYGAAKTTFEAINNIAAGVATFIAVYYNAESTLVSDYNLLSQLNASQMLTTSPTSSSRFDTFAAWQSLGHDAHSSTLAAHLDVTGTPEPPSGAIATGTNLSSYFTTDMDGDPRPLGGGWDIGARQTPPAQPNLLGAAPIITNKTTGLYRNQNLYFSYPIIASNQPSSFVESGLPNGLTINEATGVISGTATETGEWTVHISAVNASGADSETFILYITKEAAPAIDSALDIEISGKAPLSYSITATNWPSSFSAVGLPPGLTLNSWGVITGTPTAFGKYFVTITASNAGGTGSATLILTSI